MPVKLKARNSKSSVLSKEVSKFRKTIAGKI
jgi:hypothetical protein